jgi:inosose dehydratase
MHRQKQDVEKHSTIRLGAQTNAWAIDPARFETLLAVLDQIRQAGYQGFETGFANLVPQFSSPQEAKRRIAQTGLTFFGIAIFLPSERYDPATKVAPPSLYESVARGGAALGARYLSLSGAPAADEKQLQSKIAGLNAAGRFSKSVGLALAYHNHWWEFQSQSQSKPAEIEALYAHTDPALVSFLLDAGHAYRGGANVSAFLRQHHSRIVGIHFRDYTANWQQVPLGEGHFPLTEAIATLKQLQWSGWVLNEEEREDGSKYGLKVIEPALKAMRGAFST